MLVSGGLMAGKPFLLVLIHISDNYPLDLISLLNCVFVLSLSVLISPGEMPKTAMFQNLPLSASFVQIMNEFAKTCRFWQD